MRIVAVKFEEYRCNKVIKGVTGKLARQLVCLGGTKGNNYVRLLVRGNRQG